jgi:glycosyltransferase involved in cell wall biosynthesis
MPVALSIQELDLLRLSVVMPCLNEAETLRSCILKAQEAMLAANIRGEIVIADNGSTDGSQQIALECGARLIHVKDKGYGHALRGGIEAAEGEFVIMGDSDDSYEFGHIPKFLGELQKGADLVVGNRFRGGIAKGAMPPLHRYLGTPVLSWIGRVLFRFPCGDIMCGLRAFRRDLYAKLALQTTGMEFATEMIVKAALIRARICEVPTTLSPDGRSRPPHLRTWRDGWRTIRFLLGSWCQELRRGRRYTTHTESGTTNARAEGSSGR